MRTILIVLALCFSLPALAQTMTAEQKAACKADYDKYCKGTMPGGGRIVACLDKQGDNLAPACRKVVADSKKQ